LGILTGTIDKLLITPSAKGGGFDVEIIDFKTNRFRSPAKPSSEQPRTIAAVATTVPAPKPAPGTGIGSQPAQALFNFETAREEVPAQVVTTVDVSTSEPELSIAAQAEAIARDYQLQMQSYALALRELLPSDARINSLRATLHFIDPNIEISLSAVLLDQEMCARAIDDAMLSISALDGTLDADLFPPLPAAHCRICNFQELCPAGRDWLREN
jgi:hypothetical protein